MVQRFTTYVMRRVLMAIPVCLGASVVVFYLIHFIPGDPAFAIVGAWGRPEDLELIREKLRLNDPLWIQYFTWLGNVLKGDLGRSFLMYESVTNQLLERAPRSIQLGVFAMILALAVGIPTGIISALRKDSILDHLSRITAVFGTSAPNYWIGLMLIFIFGIQYRIFPVSGYVDFFEDPIRNLRGIILPTITLSIPSFAVYCRMMRSCMLEILDKDYIRTARAKGLRERVVIYKHALKNALIPIVTIAGFDIGTLMSGAVLTETIFSWPGVGLLLWNSILNRDYPTIQGLVLVLAILFVLCNLIVDIIYAYLDPRVRMG